MADDVSQPRPAPVPRDTRAKGWRFELDHERIRQSDTWALAPAEVRPWLLMLWMTAWEQTPCGSMPAEDELIAARIGMPIKAFQKHRACLMRGWWMADDGRLYHDTLVERVQEMLARKDKEKARKAEYRRRMSEGRDAMSHGTDAGLPRDSHGSDPGRDDTGTGTGTSSTTSLRSVVDGGSAQTPTPPDGDIRPSPKPKAKSAEPPPDFLGDANAEVLNGYRVAKLAEGWELPEQWGLDAEALGWKAGDILREAEKFRQYWVHGKGKGTRRSVKGWRQSWSNWLAKAERFKA